MTVVVVLLGTFVVFGFGLFVIAMLVLTSIRRKKDWAGASIVLTEEQQAALEGPANLAAAGPESGWQAEDGAVAQAQARTLGIETGPGSGPF